jgi:aryl-alcohol dehydrogenase-like predicted oxidoreductase
MRATIYFSSAAEESGSRRRPLKSRIFNMNYRQLGKTELQVSEIGFGAGIVAGLFVRGTADEQRQTVERAIELGVNHFDTAPNYGDGSSETKLGRVLESLNNDQTEGLIVGTKVEYHTEHFANFVAWTLESASASLDRLRRPAVDILYAHNIIRYGGEGSHDGYETITPDEILRPGGIADALDAARSKGLARYIGFTGTGDAEAVMEVLESGRFDVVHAYYSLLNPTASIRLPASSPLHDFLMLIDRAAALGVGVVAIRVLGGGVLGGEIARQGVSGTTNSLAMHGVSRDGEMSQAEILRSLTGYGDSELRDLAVRFAVSNADISSSLIGFSTEGQLEEAIGSLALGPPTTRELESLNQVWNSGFTQDQ